MQKMGIHSEDMATCLRSTLLGACSPALLLEIITSSKAVYDLYALVGFCGHRFHGDHVK